MFQSDYWTVWRNQISLFIEFLNTETHKSNRVCCKSRNKYCLSETLVPSNKMRVWFTLKKSFKLILFFKSNSVIETTIQQIFDERFWHKQKLNFNYTLSIYDVKRRPTSHSIYVTMRFWIFPSHVWRATVKIPSKWKDRIWHWYWNKIWNGKNRD